MKLLSLLLLFTFNAFANISFVGNPQVGFTGYKFTEKVGVSGTFKKVEWTYKKNAKDIKDLLVGAKIKIDSYSIDAGNSARDKNITAALFKNWGAREIQGIVKSVDTSKKEVHVLMTIGKSLNTLKFKYKVDKKKIEFSSSIDLIKLGFSKAFQALSKQCGPLHIGSDGKMKTWSTVDLLITGSLK